MIQFAVKVSKLIVLFFSLIYLNYFSTLLISHVHKCMNFIKIKVIEKFKFPVILLTRPSSKFNFCVDFALSQESHHYRSGTVNLKSFVGKVLH